MSNVPDRVRFTEGDCHFLAREINRRTGWPMFTFVSEYGPDLHAFVMRPDGKVLDVEGLQDCKQFRAKWDDKNLYEIGPQTWKSLKAAGWSPMRKPEYGKATYKAAKRVAANLLDLYGSIS